MTETSTMRALRVHAWGEAPRVDRVPVPEPGPGESLVRMRAATVGHLDRTIAGGAFDVRPDLPYTGGVDGAGEVVASALFAPGTAVAVRGGGLGMTRPGTWAELVAVPDEALSPMPEGLTFDLAACAYDPLVTAAVALSGVARLGEWGLGPAAEETVAVAGATGAVGSIVTQLAVRAGARVLALVRTAADADRLPAGAEPVVLTDPARRAALAEERPVTLLVDAIGGPDLVERLGWVRAGGRAAVIGYLAGTEVALDLPRWLYADVALLPVNLIRRHAEGRAAAEGMTRLLIDGALSLEVTAVPLAEGPEAYTAFAEGRLRTRLVLRPAE